MPRRRKPAASVPLAERNPATFTEDELRLLAPDVMAHVYTRDIAEARGDLGKFFGLVMNSEMMSERVLEAAPHQLLACSFIQHHPRVVLRAPRGHAKTSMTIAVTLWLLGTNPSHRALLVSKTMKQAQKLCQQTAAYIADPRLNPPLQAIFPELKRNPEQINAWAQDQFTIARPPGIKDPSATAVGLDGNFTGSRATLLIADDVIDNTNTGTKTQREHVSDNFNGRLIDCLPPVMPGNANVTSRAIVTNTPWHREDLTYDLERRAGWPTLTMDVYGNITIRNARAPWLANELPKYLRPSLRRSGAYRLIAHDPDPDEEVVLWPGFVFAHQALSPDERELYLRDPVALRRAAREMIDYMRYHDKTPHEFARNFMCQPLDEDSARCQPGWIEKCKARGLGTRLLLSYDGPLPTYTGVDVALGENSTNDLACIFTFALHPDGARQVIGIEAGHWSGLELFRRVVSAADRYNSVTAVETNEGGGKFIRELIADQRIDLPIYAHDTQKKNKADVDWGVESIFSELMKEAWIIPCDSAGKCEPEVQEWIDECLGYQAPPAHTGDRLMATWVARELARKRRRGGAAAAKGRVTGRLSMSFGGSF